MEVRWEFSAIDPLTGDLPEDPFVGFLPPNVNGPEGEGFVTYTIRPKSTVVTGDRIDAEASIVFDVNDPIVTPAIFHTFDTAPGTSQVSPLPAVTNASDFTVSWSGLDNANGAGIASYDIFVSDNSGAFEPLLVGTMETSTIFTGLPGHTYGFYSVATDGVGLRQPTPVAAQATTTVVLTPSVSIGDRSLAEGNNGMKSFLFDVTLSTPADQTVLVPYSTADGTASASGLDYLSTSGTLTFAPMTTVATVTVEVRGDTLHEGDETFFVDLGTPTGATILDGRGQGTIANDDLAPTSLLIDDISVVEGDSGSQALILNVQLSAPSGVTLSIDAHISSIDDKATVADGDYNAFSLDVTLTFAPGQTVQSLILPGVIKGDTKLEANERFFVNVTSGIGILLFDPVNVTILNDERTFATGADAGGGPHVRAFDVASRDERFGFFAYHPAFAGGVRVATGDVNGDGALDIITGAGPGGGPHVRVFDGVTGLPLPGPEGSFFAYHPNFTGGVFVASGDFNGDGRDDIVTAAGAGGGPHVRVFSGMDGTELFGFFAYNAAFGGGVSVAVDDVNGDGRDDIITGAGAGGGPHVRVFSGLTRAELFGFFAYQPSFGGGVFVAAGDVNGDGRADIYTGPGAGGGPHVRVFSGEDHTELLGFFAYNAAFTGGVRVAAGDLDGDGLADIITGAGPGGGPHVRGLSGVDLADLTGFFAYNPAFTGGVFVAGSPGGAASGALRVDGEAIAGSAADAVTSEQLELIRAAAIERWYAAAPASTGENSLLAENADFLMRSMRTTLTAAPAIGNVELLTAVLHELGHVLGLEHEDEIEGADHLMLPTLELGVRRLPRLPLVDAALAGW